MENSLQEIYIIDPYPLGEDMISSKMPGRWIPLLRSSCSKFSTYGSIVILGPLYRRHVCIRREVVVGIIDKIIFFG